MFVAYYRTQHRGECASEEPGIRDSGVWRNESARLSLVFVIVIVDVGVRTATAQNSAMAIAAGLILVVIFVFIRFLAKCCFTCSFGGFWPAWQKSGKIFSADRGLDR